MDWTRFDCIEIATVGIDREQPAATGEPVVCRIDGEDPEGYIFSAHAIYGHLREGGVECLADCWDRDVARKLGAALAGQLGVPMDDYSIDMPPD